jgi:hypothetical protein
MNIKEAKEFIREKIVEAMQLLPEDLRLNVEIPGSISDYVLKHPIGTILVFYSGSEYKKKDIAYYIAQDRDMMIDVALIVRYRKEMTPEEYIDHILKSISGVEIDVKKTDKKIYAIKDEFVEEQAGIWTYIIHFNIPEEFFEETLEEQLE